MSRKQQKQQKEQETGQRDNVRDRVINAALTLAARQGWSVCSVRDICGEAGISLAEFYDHFDDKPEIIAAYDHRLDRQVLAAFADLDFEASPRDRLFDILMERFDLLNQNRAAILSMLDSVRLDPKQALISLPYLSASMTRMMEAAGLDTNGVRGGLRVAGLSAGYVWILRTWRDDDSEDMSRTMATADKVLARLESGAGMLGL